jgi:cyanophycin synthetase
MDVLKLRVMRGPNTWSAVHHELIEMKIDQREVEDLPTDQVDGFTERLASLFPSLSESDFLRAVHRGLPVAEVIEKIAMELQTLAGMPSTFSTTKAGGNGTCHIVFGYQVEEAGIYAGRAALRLVAELISDREADPSADINHLCALQRREGLGPSTQSLVQEARKRDIPIKRLDKQSLVRLGHGVNQRVLCATMACTTSSIGVDMASDKELTRNLLADGYVPVPEGRVVYEEGDLAAAIEAIGYPLVIKPVNGNHGRAVKVNINDYATALEAFRAAALVSGEALVEQYIQGQDFRLLVIDYKLHAVAKRTPAAVVGNSESTIEELIAQANSDPNRGDGHEKILTTIKVDSVTNSILLEKNLTLNSVLAVGEILFLKDAANLSAGGTARDVTDIVHPYNVFLAERVARLMGLDICGIDVIAKNITEPLQNGNGAVLEVNAGPGFRMHLSPAKGFARNVAEPVIRMLYPPAATSRIPIVAVTGTNGKTTTTRLIAHMAKQAGRSVGYTTTDGIYIGDHAVCYGDCSGPASAETVLRDPIVDFAVLECARGGIRRSGLGFDRCDVSIITNITGDHLGLDDINSMEDLTAVKSVVAKATARTGYAILNADDDLVYALKDELEAQVALFSTDAENGRVKAHCENGGLAAVIEKGYFILCRGPWKTRVAKVQEIPLTLNGKASCMIKNILPALLAAEVSGFGMELLRKSLLTFIPGPDTTPGRMNIFKFRDYTLLLDYVHNRDGLAELARFMEQVEATSRIGIVACPGDRRDEDIVEMGYFAARIFDRIIIRLDKDSRGRPEEEIVELLKEGIRKGGDKEVTVIPDEVEAIAGAMNSAEKGAYIVACSDEIMRSTAYILSRQKEEAHSGDRLTNAYA